MNNVNGIDQFLGSAILQEIAGSPALSILMRNPDPNAWKGQDRNPESSARIRLVASIPFRSGMLISMMINRAEVS